METAQQQNNEVNVDIPKRWTCCCLLHFEKVKLIIIRFLEKIKKTAKDDPRRIMHSIKVGLALTLVSTLYHVTCLFDSFGDSAMWAVMTVVVVMEYTAGGTLSRGLNRVLATIFAVSLALGAHKIAALCGEKGERVILAAFVFLQAAAATFSRFIPEIKAKYDFGVTVFIFTFSLVAVTSYRVDDVIQLGSQRVSTIAIGVAICFCTSLFLFPVWAAEDMHKLLASNLEKLASFLEGLDTECFGDKPKFDHTSIEKPFLQVHKSVLSTKATEDSLLTFAKWEPCHGNFRFRHPWQQYQKVGGLIRQCASSIDALTLYLITLSTNQQTTTETELPLKIRTACMEMSTESAKALRDLSSAFRSMTIPSLAARHVSTATLAAAIMRTTTSDDMIVTWETIHVAVIASLLNELVDQTNEIVNSVGELMRLAKFKNTESIRSATVKPLSDHDIQEHLSISIVD